MGIKIFCYIDVQENYEKQLKKYIEALDELGYEVYLFTGVGSSGSQPHDILYSIDSQLNKEYPIEQLIFLTNITSLFHVMYRLYHQTFASFVYFKQEEEGQYILSDEYNCILNTAYSEKENLYKDIYINTDIVIQNQNYIYRTNNYFNLIPALSGITIENSDNKTTSENIFQKYYLIDNTYYVYEPIISEKKVVITFEKDNIAEAQNVQNEDGNIQYKYFYNIEKIDLLSNQIKDLSSNIVSVLGILEDLEEEMKGYYPFVYRMTICILDDLVREEQGAMDINKNLLLLSFLMQITKEAFYFNQFIVYALEDETLSGHNRFFIWNQGKRYSLINKVSTNEETGRYMKELYVRAYNEYKELIPVDLSPIPKEKRDNNTIFVFAIQFLGEGHAPTRTTLERCQTLSKGLGKRVLLINTKEQCSMYGAINIYNIFKGNVVEGYTKLDRYEYNGTSIPFFQPEEKMPALSVIVELLEYIRQIKPMMIISVGNGSIVADICGSLVPHVSIGVAFSQLATSNALFSVIGKKLVEEDWIRFEKQGYTRNNIIEGTFTFDLKEKKSRFSREMYQIPDDKFILITVGIRLDYEIKDDFIQTIRKTFEFGTHTVFAGYFNEYQLYCEKYPDFKENSTYVGFCDDILALMEICDLYVNPERLGGGFSIIEAFHEGKPGVTINTGDIAAAAGAEFCVTDYDEMVKVIERYVKDKDYYALMVKKAKEREKVVTNSSYAMEQILSRICNNKLFF